MRVQDQISILLPFKNEEKYIVPCLDSILGQSFKNWELIAVDDHSTDSSLEIVRKYSEVDKRVKLIDNSGHGVIEALETAFSQSSGQWITRMDGDDIKTPDNLEALFEQVSYGTIAIGLVKYFREDGLGAGYEAYEKWMNEVNSSGKTWDNVYRECVIPSPCWLVHRDDLKKCGGFKSELYPEDYDLCFRFYAAGLEVCCSDNVIHWWRDHENRTTRVSDKYADNRFLELKIHHFLNIDYNPERNLFLIGAGKKGKQIAKYLIEKNIPFTWCSDNSKKIDHNIYGKIIQSNHRIENRPNSDLLIAISAQQQTSLRSLSTYPGRVFYLF